MCSLWTAPHEAGHLGRRRGPKRRTLHPTALQVKFLVPNVAAGSIIGKSGANITEIQTQSNARMQVGGAGRLGVGGGGVALEGWPAPRNASLGFRVCPQCGLPRRSASLPMTPTHPTTPPLTPLNPPPPPPLRLHTRSSPAPASSTRAAWRARTASCSSPAPSTSC